MVNGRNGSCEYDFKNNTVRFTLSGEWMDYKPHAWEGQIDY